MKHFLIRRRLFFRIFLWFWLSFLVVHTVFLVASLLTQAEMFPARSRSTLVKAEALAAAELFGTNASKSGGEYLRQIETQTGVVPFLFDPNGLELTGKRAPAAAIAAFDLADVVGDMRTVPEGAKIYSAIRVENSSGQELIFVGETSRFPDTPFLNTSLQNQILRFSLTALAAGLICLWLARYLTAPIVKMSRAARQFANGDLATRVGPEFAKRKDELADLSLDFDRMAEKIEGLMRSQRRLLSDISHELRSPLARLSIALDLARGADTAERNEALNIIEREAERLNKQIEQLLTLTKLENGEAIIVVELFDLHETLSQVAADANFEASATNRNVMLMASEPCQVIGNESSIRSAVENIVRNAVRYTPENTTVEVSLMPENANDSMIVEIVVRDFGSGLPEAELEKVFQPFYRVAEGRERISGGAGLGLAIAANTARFHNGNVRAMNAADGGLIVVLKMSFDGAPNYFSTKRADKST